MNPTSKVDYKIAPHPKYGFFQITPTPTAEEITKFYADEFYSSAYPGFNNSALDSQLEDQEFLDAHREDMCQTLREISGKPLEGQEVLDIGCGWAQALIYFQKKGMKGYGFDPAPEAVEYGRKNNLTVVQAGMDKMNVFEGKRFDVVTLLNVLEHLANPVKALEEIRKDLLKPKGILVIEVPNEFNAFQVTGKEIHNLKEWWVAPPGHLNYFSNETLTRLLRGTGYEVKVTEASFPLEMFLLFGENYVTDRDLGKKCHRKRVAFELNLRKAGRTKVLREFYQNLAKLNLGRQITAFAVPS